MLLASERALIEEVARERMGRDDRTERVLDERLRDIDDELGRCEEGPASEDDSGIVS